jgi:hypothetical protein
MLFLIPINIFRSSENYTSGELFLKSWETTVLPDIRRKILNNKEKSKKAFFMTTCVPVFKVLSPLQ